MSWPENAPAKEEDIMKTMESRMDKHRDVTFKIISVSMLLVMAYAGYLHKTMYDITTRLSDHVEKTSIHFTPEERTMFMHQLEAMDKKLDRVLEGVKK